MGVSRREFVRRAGALTTAAATVSVVGTHRASAQLREHYQAQPDGVELVYDEALLMEYRPLLEIAHLEYQPRALYGLVARDTDDATRPHSTDVLVYWADYLGQDGVMPAAQGPLSDSHHGDHEPVYVVRNKDDGSVESIMYSAYHWLRARELTPRLVDGTHPVLRVVKPWHHYTRFSETAESRGEYVDLADLTEAYPSWLDNGLAEDIQPGVVTNPWTMEDREHWWRESGGFGFGFGVSGTALLARAFLFAGLRGGSEDL